MNEPKPSFAKRIRAAWPDFANIYMPAYMNRVHRVVTLPFSIFFLTYSAKVDPAYRFSQWDRVKLGLRFYANNARVTSASYYRAHLVMAIKLLEMPPTVEGCVVECGCYKGAMTVNLSIVCKIVGRELKVYDSFEGLPPPTTHDFWPEGVGYFAGVYKGALEEVTENVRKLGVLEVCEFRKGWFKDTLPEHKEPVALAVVDVDYHSSLYDCVTMLWSHLSESAYFFIDEYVFTDYCALFFSEKFWREHFQCAPPGLYGSGCGVQVGEYYLGPWSEMWMSQNPASIAYTRKGMKAVWEYYPKETPPELRHPELAATGGAPAV